MISLPDYSKMANSIGRIVDGAGEDALYLVDSCFFFPTNPFRYHVPTTDCSFRGDFFSTYYNVLMNCELKESDYEKCASAMDKIESFFAGYAEFLKVIVDSGLQVRTTPSVIRETRNTVRVYRGFFFKGSGVSATEANGNLVSRKKKMLSKQRDYVCDIFGDGCLSVIEGNGLIDPDDFKTDPAYREILCLLLDNACEMKGQRVKGVDEELLAAALHKAAEGEQVVLMSADHGFSRHLERIYRSGKLEDMRRKIVAGRGLSVVCASGKNGLKRTADTDWLEKSSAANRA